MIIFVPNLVPKCGDYKKLQLKLRLRAIMADAVKKMNDPTKSKSAFEKIKEKMEKRKKAKEGLQ